MQDRLREFAADEAAQADHTSDTNDQHETPGDGAVQI